MLGATQADSLGAEVARDLGVGAVVGVGPDAQGSEVVGPAHEGVEVFVELGLDGVDPAEKDTPGVAIDGDPVVAGNGAGRRLEQPLPVIDLHLVAAHHAALAHAPCHHGSVRGHAAAGGDDGLCGHHAVEVVGIGLVAHQDDRLALAGQACGPVGVEGDPARGGAGRSRQADGQDGWCGRRIDDGMQQLLHVIGRDAQEGFLLADQLLAHHVHGDAYGGPTGSLAGSCLQHPEVALLHRELDVLHVAVMGLEQVGHPLQLVVDRGVQLGQLRDGRRRADAGHHVLSLGVGQVLAEENRLAGAGIAGEGDAGTRVLARVAEDHGLDADGGADVVGDAVETSIVDGSPVHPGVEDGCNRQAQLFLGIGGDELAGFTEDDGLVAIDQALELLDVQIGITSDAGLLDGHRQGVVQALGGDAQHDLAEHLHEAAVGVPGEAFVAGELHQALQCVLVDAQVEHGVHHARHRNRGAGSGRDQQRIRGIAEALARGLFDGQQCLLGLCPHVFREVLVVSVVGAAGAGGDGETGGDGQLGPEHLGQAGPFPAQGVDHVQAAFGKMVDPFGHVLLSCSCSFAAFAGIEPRLKRAAAQDPVLHPLASLRQNQELCEQGRLFQPCATPYRAEPGGRARRPSQVLGARSEGRRAARSLESSYCYVSGQRSRGGSLWAMSGSIGAVPGWTVEWPPGKVADAGEEVLPRERRQERVRGDQGDQLLDGSRGLRLHEGQRSVPGRLPRLHEHSGLHPHLVRGALRPLVRAEPHRKRAAGGIGQDLFQALRGQVPSR